jgi:hypothetical protein
MFPNPHLRVLPHHSLLVHPEHYVSRAGRIHLCGSRHDGALCVDNSDGGVRHGCAESTFLRSLESLTYIITDAGLLSVTPFAMSTFFCPSLRPSALVGKLSTRIRLYPSSRASPPALRLRLILSFIPLACAVNCCLLSLHSLRSCVRGWRLLGRLCRLSLMSLVLRVLRVRTLCCAARVSRETGLIIACRPGMLCGGTFSC